MTHKEPPVWTKDAAEFVRSFLQSPVGSAAFMHLANLRPTMSAGEAGNDLNRAALSGQFAAGYESCLKTFLRLAESPDSRTPTVVDNYPDIENDAAFADGLKLTEPQEQTQ